MINLYPFRATDSGKLPQELNVEHHKANLEAIDTTLNDYQEIECHQFEKKESILLRTILFYFLQSIPLTTYRNLHRKQLPKVGNQLI
jgi:hypothetical protein